MKMLVWLVVALFASAGIALLVKEDPGYVLITVGQWTVESTVAVLVVALIVAFVVLYKLVRWLSAALDMPKAVRKANERHRERKAHRLLALGSSQLAEGRWQQAERTLANAAKSDNQVPQLGYLAAARAAQQKGDSARRDYYLRCAGSNQPDAAMVVSLTQAELLVEQGQVREATAVLDRLRQQNPKHPQVLRKLMTCYESVSDWQNLWTLLPDIRNRKVLEGDQFTSFEARVYRELLATRAKEKSPQPLRELWKGMPRYLREQPDLLVDYAGYLEAHGAADESEKLIRRALDRKWDSRLLLAYGELSRCDPELQLRHAEALLRSHQDDPDLLLSLGRIARRNHHWQKARGYYEASIAAKPGSDAYQELGSLLDQLDEPDRARDCYRNGLQLLTGRELGSASTVLVPAAVEPVAPVERVVEADGDAKTVHSAA